MSVMEPLVLPKNIAVAVKRLHLLPKEFSIACGENADPDFSREFIQTFETYADELSDAILDKRAFDDLQGMISGNQDDVATGAIVLQMVRHFCFSFMWGLPLGTSVYFHPTETSQLCLCIATSCPVGYLKLV